MTVSDDGSGSDLAELRRSGDASALAEALVRHSNDLLRNGRTREAREALDEAASIHGAYGRVLDEARCLRFAAALCRFEGKTEEARRRAVLALALVGDTAPADTGLGESAPVQRGASAAIAASAHAELGDIAMAEGNNADAAAAFGAALAAGESGGPDDAARAALLRRRAVAFLQSGQVQAAIGDLAGAADHFLRAGDRPGAARALIEQATASRNAGLTADVGWITGRAMELAEPAQDHAALADLHLLFAAQLLDEGDAAAAMDAAREARTQALAARAPAPYIGAAVAIARLAELSGDRGGAYQALATAWATLADLLGGEAARRTFEPALLQMRDRWGAAGFDEVRSAYERRRRSERDTGKEGVIPGRNVCP